MVGSSGFPASGRTTWGSPRILNSWAGVLDENQAPSRRRTSQQPSSSLDRSPGLQRVEAALFVADRPISAGRLAKAAQLVDAKSARQLVEELQENLNAAKSPFRVEKLASGYRLLTRPEYAFWLGKLHPKPSRVGLSPTALETLTIVAYRQPLTRADVEAIRGVQSLEVLKQLADRGLIRIVGEDDSLGRPYLYGTTPLFLELFGVSAITDLPDHEALSKPAA